MLYVTVKSYKATKGDEATVAIGVVVEVLQKSENGWWLIRYDSNAKTAANGAEDGPLGKKNGSSDRHVPPLWFTCFLVLVLHSTGTRTKWDIFLRCACSPTTTLRSA